MPRGLLADANLVGHVRGLVAHLAGGEWAELWRPHGLPLVTFNVLGLSTDTPDRELWRVCQREELILVTANRNHDGPDSLEAVIRTENTAAALPVFTISDAERVFQSRDYADRVALSLLEHILDLPVYLGSGRVYLP